MSMIELGAIALGSLVLGLAVLRLAWFAVGGERRDGGLPLNRDGSIALQCSVCGARSVAGAIDLTRLSPAEKALVARERPDTVGQDLVEFNCPHCDASHCFRAERNQLTFVGSNFYQAQRHQASCRECQRALAAPPWTAGAYDGDLAGAPGNISHLGLECHHCGALCCVACSRDATRNRTADGSLLCPRCFRGPLGRFWHPVRLEGGNFHDPAGIHG